MQALLLVVFEPNVLANSLLVQEEAFRLGSEAIRNACLHADATRIEIELDFEPDLLERVKDDGKGMSLAVASQGREGHFGLRCMRERASRIGARLSIDTSPGAGTVVTLGVSRAIAFETNDGDDPKGMDRAPDVKKTEIICKLELVEAYLPDSPSYKK